jgi:hypothetical protein
MTSPARRGVLALWAARVDAIAALTILAGWAVLWWGIGDVLARWLPARGIWAIGLGLFLLSCMGWKMLHTLAKVGLYALSKADTK